MFTASATTIEFGDPDILRMFTDAGEVKRFRKNLQDNVAVRVATAYVEEVKYILDSGTADGPAVKPETLERRKFRSTGKLVDSEDMMCAFKVHEIQGDVFGGIRTGTINRKGERLDWIAYLHEHGSLRVPARPFSSKGARKVAGNRDMLSSIMDKAVEEELDKL